MGTIVAVVGKTFENALAAAMYHARSLSTRSVTDNKVELASSEVQPQWLESWYDGLGYCMLPSPNPLYKTNYIQAPGTPWDLTCPAPGLSMR